MDGFLDSFKTICTNETIVILVRHGETTWNQSGILQGQAESELNDLGIKQAEAAAEYFSHLKSHVNFSAIYSSDLSRAFKTAQIIAKNLFIDVVSVSDLRERHLGVLQGMSKKQCRIDQPDAFAAFTSRMGSEAIPGGGESTNEFTIRVVKALASIASKHTGQVIVVVCHGGVLNALYHHAYGRNSPKPAYNASLSILRIGNGIWNIDVWNYIQHIKSGGIHVSFFGGEHDSA